MNIRLDFDPGKLPSFIDQLPTWQRELAHEVYNCFIREDGKWEKHYRNRKAVELFWQGKPVMDPPFEGRYRLDNALEDFAYMTFGKKVVFAFKDTSGKPYMQAECPLGTWGAGGLLANELNVLMLDIWRKAGNHFKDWRFSFTKTDANPRSLSCWIIRLHPKDFICSDGVWTTVTDKWYRLVERGRDGKDA